MVFATFRLLGRYQQASFGTVSRKTLIIRPSNKLLDMVKEKDSQLQKLKEEKDFELKHKEFLLEKIRQEKDSEIKEMQHLIDSLRLEMNQVTERMHDEKNFYSLQIGELSQKLILLESEFRTTKINYLIAQSRIDVRVGIEYGKQSIRMEYSQIESASDDEDPQLAHFLKHNEKFKKSFGEYLAVRKLTIADVRKSFVLLWHSSSKHLHGRPLGYLLIYEGNLAPHELDCLSAFFQHLELSYKTYSKTGALISSFEPPKELVGETAKP
jgi:hypothetical protein